MFGLLISGRLVDTSFREVDPTHVVIDIHDVQAFNHVVVFLTGQRAFPEDMGGAVYFTYPPITPWQLLGSLSNAKPSAIFKISKLKQASGDNINQQDLINRFGGIGDQHPQEYLNNQNSCAQLGISMEPLVSLAGQTPVAAAEASSVPTFVEFSQKMVENLFNYTSSFALSGTDISQGKNSPSSRNETYVPFSSMQCWYSNFERRLHHNPFFWKN